jgi:hypothetical protein
VWRHGGRPASLGRLWPACLLPCGHPNPSPPGPIRGPIRVIRVHPAPSEAPSESSESTRPRRTQPAPNPPSLLPPGPRARQVEEVHGCPRARRHSAGPATRPRRAPAWRAPAGSSGPHRCHGREGAACAPGDENAPHRHTVGPCAGRRRRGRGAGGGAQAQQPARASLRGPGRNCAHHEPHSCHNMPARRRVSHGTLSI